MPGALASAIERCAPVELAAQLVSIPSHPGVARQEEEAVRALAAFLERHGLECELDEVEPGRPNLLCRVRGAESGRRLVLCGHSDTVPPNRGDPGFGLSGELRDGQLRGRGAADMKGGVAAMAAAVAALASTPGALPAGEVVLAVVVDEEMRSLGAERLVERRLQADGAIVGEPTGNRLCLGHKGLEWVEVELRGRAAHGGSPERGVNAIVAASRFLTLVERELLPELARRRHSLLGPPTLNFGTIEGGDQPSTVAARCRLTADRRLVPGESWATARAEIEALLGRVEAQLPGLRTHVGRCGDGMATLEHVPLVTAADHPIARACAEARRQVGGEEGEPGAFPAWTDGALLAGFARIPTVVLGPGELAVAHTPRECVAVREIVEASRLYALAASLFCSPAAR